MIRPTLKLAAFSAAFLCLLVASGCSNMTGSRIADKGIPIVPELIAPEAKRYVINLNLLQTAAAVRGKCGHKAEACAIPESLAGACELYMNVNDFDGYIVHEIRHCTNGFWHE